MCGITGFVKTADRTYATEPVLRSVFEVMQIRGEHASGIAALMGSKKKREIGVAKGNVPSTEFVQRDEWKEFVPRANVLIAHTRYAVYGNPSDNINNHPHSTDDYKYSLIHNGIVHDRPKSVRGLLKSKCDSEILLRLLEKNGVVKGFRKIAHMKRSSVAVLVIKADTGVLYAYRNEHSPLVYCDLTTEIGGLLFASTAELMVEGIRKAGFDFGDIERRCAPIIPNVVYAFTTKRRYPKTKVLTESVVQTVT